MRKPGAAANGEFMKPGRIAGGFETSIGTLPGAADKLRYGSGESPERAMRELIAQVRWDASTQAPGA